MGLIQLSKPGLFTVVDDADHAHVNEYLWCPMKGSHGNVYAGAWIDGKKVRLHRLLLGSEGLVDHLNGNTLDNRRCNLRPCTFAGNSRNAGKRKHATSKFKGVSFHKEKKRWQARICYEYREIHLGYFNRERSAAAAYNKAARKYFGEFARLKERDEMSRRETNITRRSKSDGMPVSRRAGLPILLDAAHKVWGVK